MAEFQAEVRRAKQADRNLFASHGNALGFDERGSAWTRVVEEQQHVEKKKFERAEQKELRKKQQEPTTR